MSYQVFARKCRPRFFQEMVGQEHVLKALAHALDHDKVHHAYLFTGTRGVGKTTIARIFAKCVNCEQGMSSRPCGVCTICKAVDEGRFVDLIEIDAASRTKVEDTRELLENVPYLPSQGQIKVYLIDEVHMLSNHSFNALLKTLEEPPAHVKFILATTDPLKLPPTILSRCLQFHLKSLTELQIKQHLAAILEQEKITFEEEALFEMARAAGGSMRDALSLLEQVIALGAGQVRKNEVLNLLGLVDQNAILQLLCALCGRHADRVVDCIRALDQFNPNHEAVLGEILLLLQQASWYQVDPRLIGSESQKRVVAMLAGQVSADVLQRLYQIALMGRRDLSLAPDPKSGFEMVLLRMMAFLPAETKSEGIPATVDRAAHLSFEKLMEGLQTAATPPETASFEKGDDPLPHTLQKIPPVPPFSKGGTGRGGDEQPSQPFDWNALVPKLNLTGVAKLLASHCAFEKKEHKMLSLLLAPAQAPLLNERLRLSIEKAIGDFLKEPITLKIEIGVSAEQTKAALDQKLADQKRNQVIEEIETDQNLQALLKRVGGKIEEVKYG